MTNELIAYRVDPEGDFMREKDGRLYVPGAEEIKAEIDKTEEKVEKAGIRKAASRDRHFKDDTELLANGGPFPEHCMDKQYGQKNADGTFGIDFIPEIRNNEAYVVENKIAEGDNFRRYTTAELAEIADGEGDIVFEKQHYDVFTNPAVEPLLKQMGVKEAIVYGVATDYCVKAAVVGMQERGIQCYVLEDAIAAVNLDPEDAELAIKEMKQAGAIFTTLEDILK
ncbi:cysteine hydrolase [Candidatus Woesearchaeota archaeon]|nr:cysteine hydrolase [Candidatus Woesearchaeota archaeon]